MFRSALPAAERPTAEHAHQDALVARARVQSWRRGDAAIVERNLQDAPERAASAAVRVCADVIFGSGKVGTSAFHHSLVLTASAADGPESDRAGTVVVHRESW